MRKPTLAELEDKALRERQVERQAEKLEGLARSWRSLMLHCRRLPYMRAALDPDLMESPKPHLVRWIEESIADMEAVISDAKWALAAVEEVLIREDAQRAQIMEAARRARIPDDT
jgi:hypothetical protein